MTIDLNPEDEQYIQQRLQSGAFASAEDVIHRALQSLNSEEDWLRENKEAIGEQIERAFAQFERGEGLTPEESLARLETKKAAWRTQRRHA